MNFSSSKIEYCCNEMQIAINNIQSIFNQIDSIKNQLIKSESWKGQSASFYIEMLNSFTSTFDEIINELNNDLHYLVQTKDGYLRLNQITLEGLGLTNKR